MITNNYLQGILDEAKKNLKTAILLRKNGGNKSAKRFISMAYKKIDELLESAPYLKEAQLENAPERENFDSEDEFNIEYLSEHLRAIEEDLD